MSTLTQRSYLIIGRLPTSPLFKKIQSHHTITQIVTKSVSRAAIISQISALPRRHWTFVLIFSEAQHLYPIDRDLLGSISIECVCKVGAGYDSVDVEYFTSRGTWVANTPNAVRVPTAEWAVAMILATVKGVGLADRNMRKGKYRTGLGFQNNIVGMTLGIVGLGAIGKVQYSCPFGVDRVGSCAPDDLLGSQRRVLESKTLACGRRKRTRRSFRVPGRTTHPIRYHLSTLSTHPLNPPPPQPLNPLPM